MTSQEFEEKARKLWEEAIHTSGLALADRRQAIDRLTVTTMALAWGDRLLDQGFRVKDLRA